MGRRRRFYDWVCWSTRFCNLFTHVLKLYIITRLTASLRKNLKNWTLKYIYRFYSQWCHLFWDFLDWSSSSLQRLALILLENFDKIYLVKYQKRLSKKGCLLMLLEQGVLGWLFRITQIIKLGSTYVVINLAMIL